MGVVARAFVWLLYVELTLRWGGHRRLVPRALSPGTAVGDVSVADLARARRYARAVGLVSRVGIVGRKCLARSLALHALLGREHLPSQLRVGVRKRGSALEAHAWVELGGQVLGDPATAVEPFTPLATEGRSAL